MNDRTERELSEVSIGALCWNQYTDWPTFLEAGIRAERLGELLGTFTEGLDAPDVVAARAVLGDASP